MCHLNYDSEQPDQTFIAVPSGSCVGHRNVNQVHIRRAAGLLMLPIARFHHTSSRVHLRLRSSLIGGMCVCRPDIGLDKDCMCQILLLHSADRFDYRASHEDT